MPLPPQYKLPEDRHYHPSDHLWAMPSHSDGQLAVLIGMDAMQLDNLGELAYIDLKPVGSVVNAGDSIGTLEAAKMTAEIFAPISGTIANVNRLAMERPLLVNESPYEAGWMLVIHPSRWDEESADLITGKDIAPWAEQEFRRFQEQPGEAE